MRWRLICGVLLLLAVGCASWLLFKPSPPVASAIVPATEWRAPVAERQAPPTVPKAAPAFIPPPWPNGESPKAPKAGKPIDELQDSGDGVVRVEESGPDISKTDPDVLLQNIVNAPSTDKSAMRAAWELGNRAIQAGWTPTKEQADTIAQVVDKLIDDNKLGDSDYYSNSRNQLYRFWSLAHPALVRALEPQRKHRDLVVKTLAATRTKALVEELLHQYQHEADTQRKSLLAFTLSCMKEQRRVGIPHRQVMGVEDSASLYESINPIISTKPQ